MLKPLTYRQVLREAWPYILANATTPLLGLTDTAVLGHGGSAVDLAAIAMGALVFSFTYWTFGFLRMGTTGFVAQALGAGRCEEVAVAGLRAVVLGATIGVALLLLSPVIEWGAFSLLHGDAAAEFAAGSYFRARIGGAPAALATLGASGVLIGLGKAKLVLLGHLVTNGVNIVLDVFFVQGLGWGATGVGWGTAIAEWTGLAVSLFLALRAVRGIGVKRAPWRELASPSGWRVTFQANLNIMVRTLSMILGFAFFTDRGAQLGVTALAGNHLLLQYISFSAFFLDGFAHVAESHVGAALGARDEGALSSTVRVTTVWAAAFAGALALGILLLGDPLSGLLTDIGTVREAAEPHLSAAACYVAVSFLAFQLDGVFIGGGWTKSMRNAALFCSAWFLACGSWASHKWGNTGLWWSFVTYVALRGLSLLVLLRARLKESLERGRN